MSPKPHAFVIFHLQRQHLALRVVPFKCSQPCSSSFLLRRKIQRALMARIRTALASRSRASGSRPRERKQARVKTDTEKRRQRKASLCVFRDLSDFPWKFENTCLWSVGRDRSRCHSLLPACGWQAAALLPWAGAELMQAGRPTSGEPDRRTG